MPKFILAKESLEDCAEHGLRPQYLLGANWGICDKCLHQLLRAMNFTICEQRARFVRIDKLGEVELAIAG